MPGGKNVKIFFATNGRLPQGDADTFRLFSCPGCTNDENGDDSPSPTNLASVMTFVAELDAEVCLAAQASQHIVCSTGSRRQSMNRTVFLLGAYLMLRLELSADDVRERFSGLDGALYEDLPETCPGASGVTLTVGDRWRGMWRAMSAGWLAAPPGAGGRLWGMYDADEVARLGDPLNGDVTVAVPGRLLAFRGPRRVAGGGYADLLEGGRLRRRDFGAAHYAGLLGGVGVSTVIRLSDAGDYDGREFAGRGIRHVDLFFEDGTCPPPAVVAGYLAAVAGAPGAVAVHCAAGLGRTGTLLAVSLMLSHGFAAREAVGWLRVVRPGSVIGRQLDYLCGLEAAARAGDLPEDWARAAAATGGPEDGPAAGRGGAGPRGRGARDGLRGVSGGRLRLGSPSCDPPRPIPGALPAGLGPR